VKSLLRRLSDIRNSKLTARNESRDSPYRELINRIARLKIGGKGTAPTDRVVEKRLIADAIVEYMSSDKVGHNRADCSKVIVWVDMRHQTFGRQPQ
jgi:hypothetical protein